MTGLPPSDITIGSGYRFRVVNICPPTWSDERRHVLDDTCWCHPLFEIVSGSGVEGPWIRLTHKGKADE